MKQPLMGGDRLLNQALNLEAVRCKSSSPCGYMVTRDQEPLGWTASMLAVLGESVISEEPVDRDMTWSRSGLRKRVRVGMRRWTPAPLPSSFRFTLYMLAKRSDNHISPRAKLGTSHAL
jgi:hypothetical protein